MLRIGRPRGTIGDDGGARKTWCVTESDASVGPYAFMNGTRGQTVNQRVTSEGDSASPIVTIQRSVDARSATLSVSSSTRR